MTFMSEMPRWRWWYKLWPWSRYWRIKRSINRLPKTKWKIPLVRAKWPNLTVVFKED